MKGEYKRARDRLLEIKKEIENYVKNNNITNKLLDFESELDKTYNTAIQKTGSNSDKIFISLNYFAPKTYILLAKGQKFEAVNSFCEAVSYYIQFLNNISNPDFNNKWGLNYYYSISFHLVNSDIEFFGNTPKSTVENILNSLHKILSITSNHPNFKISVDWLLSNFLFSLVTKSSEIYTSEHLEIAKQIKNITSYIIKANDYINGILKSLEFILARRELHYYLRQLVPKGDQNIDRTSIYENIKEVVKNMKMIARDEIEFFKNIPNNVEESISFKKFLAEIDKLSSEYYESLWIKRDLIDTFKKLETIFSMIRNNWQKIITPDIFSHYVQEFVFLSNYFKLLLLARDFKEFEKHLAEKEWQKEVAIRVGDSLNKIATEFFKYEIPSSLHRKLLIVEEASSGKFVEFIVFYLLREFIINTIPLENRIKNIANSGIRNLLSIINKIQDISKIEWNRRISNEASDIDILIDEKYGIFLKTGILNSDDRKKIFNEIELSKKIKLQSIFQIIDIAKNLDMVSKLSNKDPNVNLIDIGEFLRRLLEIAHTNEKIAIELSESSILSYAGFYSGG